MLQPFSFASLRTAGISGRSHEAKVSHCPPKVRGLLDDKQAVLFAYPRDRLDRHVYDHDTFVKRAAMFAGDSRKANSDIAAKGVPRVPGTAVFLTRAERGVPPVMAWHVRPGQPLNALFPIPFWLSFYLSPAKPRLT